MRSRRDSAVNTYRLGESVIARKQPASPTAAAPASARDFALQAARLASDTRCHSVVVLDVANLSPVTDFFVIATGTSARQMRSVADDIGELGEASNFAPLTISGEKGETWILLDCVDVVVHIFSGDARLYYDLDGLWGDAKRVEWDLQKQDNSVSGDSSLHSD